LSIPVADLTQHVLLRLFYFLQNNIVITDDINGRSPFLGIKAFGTIVAVKQTRLQCSPGQNDYRPAGSYLADGQFQLFCFGLTSCTGKYADAGVLGLEIGLGHATQVIEGYL